jgi:hypothetical protein
MRIGTRQLDTFLDGLPHPSLPDLYRDLINRVRVRAVHLPGRISRPRVVSTLLGHELILGNWRKGCPDTSTARFLRVFAALGCRAAFVPYNPVDTAGILPQLEAAGADLEQRLSDLVPAGSSPRRLAAIRQRLYRRLADRLASMRPAFPTGGNGGRHAP